MPITRGAKKAERSSKRKRVYNVRRTGTMNDAVKKLKKTIVAGDTAGAEKLLPVTYQSIDKAAKRGVINKNTADRKKSRLVASIKRATAK